jgi:CheY-like chemotaxis protein
LLRSSLPATVEIDAKIDSNTPVVLADPTQIHQVVMNLCMNAAHAMRGHPGCLTVVLQPCDVDEALAHSLHGLRPERYARLTVSDTGHGIDAETVKHIFEPFFTTKGPGEGTGLGLAVVHGIVKDHEGVIAVQSQPDVGTTFDVYFPIHQTTPVEASEIPAKLPRGRGEHILFVDDEAAICTSAQIILERLGYHVTVQTDPSEALIQFCKCPDQFDLVITDLTMPRVTGSELAQQISRLRPKMPVLLATGFNDAWTPDKLREFGVRELLAKPMTPLVLATTVQRALNPELETGI